MRQVRTMETPKLIQLRAQIDATLDERRRELEAQMAEFEASVDGNYAAVFRGTAKKKKKAVRKFRYEPKYQSKQDRRLKWTGQGNTPRWMREEIFASRGKLKKDDFVIR